MNKLLEKMGNTLNYLDYRELSSKQTIRRVARLHSYKIKTSTETQKMYMTMHLRDRNNVHVMATMFEVEDPDDLNLMMKTLKGRVVEITGVVSIFGDRYTLHVNLPEHIKLVTDSSAESVFSRKIEGVESLVEEIRGTYGALGLEASPSLTLEFQSADHVYDGKAGGIIKFMNDVVRASTAYVRAPGIDTLLFAKCLYVALEVIAEKLVKESTLGFVDNMGMYEKIHSYKSSDLFDETTFPVAFDVMSGTVGLTKPEHPYSVIINKLVESSLELQRIVSHVPTLIIGNSVDIGGTRLSAF